MGPTCVVNIKVSLCAITFIDALLRRLRLIIDDLWAQSRSSFCCHNRFNALTVLWRPRNVNSGTIDICFVEISHIFPRAGKIKN